MMLYEKNEIVVAYPQIEHLTGNYD